MKIVLVEPQHPGNVGAVARVMANFGIDDLALVKGCEIDDDGYARSKSGRPVLENLKRFETMKKALADCDIAIVNFYFVLKWDYILLPKPNAISIANTDYYVFLCQNCTKSSKEQMKEAYTVITKRACT